LRNTGNDRGGPERFNSLCAEKRMAEGMREILFRGKQEGKGGWVYGGIQHYGNITGEYSYIIVGQILSEFVYIIPKTMGQYTGFEAADSNRYITVDGKKEKDLRIFEGDIIRMDKSPFMGKSIIGEIVWESGGLWFKYKNPIRSADGLIGIIIVGDHGSKIIGNVHDTPELLSRE
jgi:hypothetical protein